MLSEFTLFAAGKVRGLCEGLQAVSLPYRCGKCLKCGHCSKITFHEMGEGEKGGPPMLACSCKRAVSLEDEFKKELDISRLGVCFNIGVPAHSSTTAPSTQLH